IILVAAETADIAEEAVELVKIEYEELPAVFDVEEAMKKDPPVIIHPERSSYTYEPSPRYPQMLDPAIPNLQTMAVLRTGDVERGFKEADLIVENRYDCQSVQHCPIETHIADAWVEIDGTLTVRISHQGYFFVRRDLDHFAVQCGFCTPGMILTAKALLDENPNATEEDIKHSLHGNLCRCTGYVKIVEAILAAKESMLKGGRV
ncbi:unnamed protein product, partial [marine sediment metagenome]